MSPHLPKEQGVESYFKNFGPLFDFGLYLPMNELGRYKPKVLQNFCKNMVEEKQKKYFMNPHYHHLNIFMRLEVQNIFYRLF